MSARTLRTWSRTSRPERPRGRPRTSARRRLEARRLVARAWRAQGRGAGVRPVAAVLAGRVSSCLVRRLLAQIKRLHRARQRSLLASRRTRIDVAARDVMWSMDATHLARDAGGAAVEAQLVREAAAPRILAIEVGPPAQSEDVLRLLDRTAAERGHLPLVLVTDNGPAYVSESVESWLASNGVVHLHSLPRTPQHNAWVERTNAELKAETGLGRGVVVSSAKETRERVETARRTLDDVRLRSRSPFKTAAAADAEKPRWYNVTTRERFLATLCRRLAEHLPCADSARARRRARREAIYASLEELELVRRTRGGR